VYSQVGINTTAPTRTIDVNGDARIRSLPTLTSPTVSPLFSDENGVLGKATISLQSQIAFYTSNDTFTFVASSYNAGNDQIVPILSSHATLNTIGVTVPATGNINISQTGTYMLSGSITPILAISSGGDGYAYMAVNLEVSTNGGTSWTSISGGRSMFPRVTTGVDRTYSFVIPSVLKQLNAGDLVRIKFYRTSTDPPASTLQGSSVSGITLANGFGAPSFTFAITKL
jgi:hypothetical protein